MREYLLCRKDSRGSFQIEAAVAKYKALPSAPSLTQCSSSSLTVRGSWRRPWTLSGFSAMSSSLQELQFWVQLSLLKNLSRKSAPNPCHQLLKISRKIPHRRPKCQFHCAQNVKNQKVWSLIWKLWSIINLQVQIQGQQRKKRVGVGGGGGGAREVCSSSRDMWRGWFLGLGRPLFGWLREIVRIIRGLDAVGGVHFATSPRLVGNNSCVLND